MTNCDNSEVHNRIKLLEEEYNEDGKNSCCCCKCCALKCRCHYVVCTCDCRSISKSEDINDDNNRGDYLYKKWSINGCQLLYSNFIQDILRKHFGIGIATYFLVLKIFFIWVMIMLFVGVISTAASFYTMHDNINPATPVCKADYKAYYMCPLCDKQCSFWYFKQAISSNLCTRHFRLIFDNPIVWAFTFVLIASAFVLTMVIICCSINQKRKSDISQQVLEEEFTYRNDCCFVCCTKSDSSCSLCCDFSFLIFPGCHYCSIFWQWIWLVFSIFMILGFFSVFVLLSLVIEREVRRSVVNRYNTSRFLTFILATVPVALLQTTVNVIVKWLYRVALRSCYCQRRVNTYISEFIMILIPSMVISYSPIVYRIIFYGNLVGDPQDGYLHLVNDLRFQHCPEYGCMDIGAYTFLGILSSSVSPLWKICSKMLEVRIICYKNTENNNSSSCKAHFRSCICHFVKVLGKLSELSKTNHMVECYVELLMIYGYIIFFVVANGAVPLLAAVVTIPLIARYKSNNYVLWNQKKKIKERNLYSFSLSGLVCAFLTFTALSTVTNVAIFIPNSRFIQHISYSKNVGQKQTVLLHFTGYLDEVLPKHRLTTLVEKGIFPNIEAQTLPLLYPNGKKVRNSTGEPILYLPYIDFKCLNNYFPGKQNFTTEEFNKFFKNDSISNNFIINYNTNSITKCFNENTTCRSRGYLKGSDNSKNLSMIRKLFAISAIGPFITLMLVYFVCIPIFCCKLNQRLCCC